MFGFNTSGIGGSGNSSLWGGIATTIGTIGTTFSNVWNSTHNTVPVEQTQPGTIVLPAQVSSSTFGLTALLLGGGLLAALFMLFNKR